MGVNKLVMYHKALEMNSYERDTLEEAMNELMVFVTKNEHGVDADIDRIIVHQDKESEKWYGTVYYFALRRVRM